MGSSLPPELGNILDDNKFKKNKFMIPYYASAAAIYRVHILDTNGANNKAAAIDNVIIYNRATDAFITHYFPEYYPFLMDGKVAIESSLLEEIASFKPYYETLRQEIYDSLSVKRTELLLPFPGSNPRLKVVMESDIDFSLKRTTAEEAQQLPDMQYSIEVFATERSAGTVGAQTTFQMVTMPNATERMTGVLDGFGEFGRAMQNIANTPVDFNGLQSGTSMIINTILQVIYDSIRSDEASPPPAAYDTDSITVYFNEDLLHPQIISIEYFILNITASETEPATVGFISNVKYNPMFHDPLTLGVLKNYDQILQNSSQDSGLTGQSSITQFFKTLGMGTGPSFTPQIGDIPGSLTPGNNIFGNRPSDNLVDANDIGHLENLFSTIMTAEEVQQLEQTAADPEITKRILQKQKATKIKAGIQTVKIIDDILNFNFPLFGPNLTKEGRAVNAVLSQFGIQEMAKEALICLTLGLGATASRITTAVKNSLVETASSLRNDPIKPSGELNIERPNMSKGLKNPGAYFSVSGSPPLSQRIKDIILNALANAGFEIIKSLAEMIQLNCGEILKDLAGAVDLGREIRERAAHAALDIPNLEDLMEQQMAQYDLSLEEGYTYFTDVSRILDPRQICRLLNGPSEVLDSTIDELIEFNKAYPLVAVNNKLITRNAIMNYFRSLTSQIDTVTFCNDMINNYIFSAVQNCNICLDTDLLGANPAIANLIDIAENGITLVAPKIDFLCPESENYLENPVATHILPNLWNNILDTTKIYMAGSIESARTSLLDATIVNTINPDLCAAFAATGVMPATSSLDPSVLNFITELFGFIEGITDTTFEVINDNNGACADINMDKLEEVMDNMEVIIGAINSALGELPGVIEEVDGKISALQASMESEGPNCGAPHVEYAFPEAFKASWNGAISTLEPLSLAGYATNTPKRFIVEPWPGTGSAQNIFGPSRTYTSNDIDRVKDAEILFKRPGAATICSIKYLEPDPLTDHLVEFKYNVLGTGFQGTINDLVAEEYQLDPEEADYQTYSMNPYVYNFVAPVMSAQNVDLSDTQHVIETIGYDYAQSYGGLVQNMFAYIAANGAFSTDRINNLNFFKNNTNCEPENIGDLFDSDGILDQMKKEFAAAACEDTGSSKDKVRNTLYFGLLMMLVQAIIDEFVVKNIIVFTAFRMNEILSPNYPFKEFMITEIVKSFHNVRFDGNDILEREIFGYFNRLSQRTSTLVNGGITHTYDPETPLSGFEGTEFPQSTEGLIRFLVEERLGYTWMDGTTPRSTIKAIQNIIEPGDNKKSVDEVILEDVVGLYNEGEIYENLSRIFPNRASLLSEYGFFEDMVTTDFVNNAVDITTEGIALLITDDGTQVSLVYLTTELHDALELPAYYEDWRNTMQGAVLFTIPISPTYTRAQILETVKTSPVYQKYMNQTFNKNAILMVPIIYNFYLTNKYFTDITDSFRGTKRAIINFMNMTDASTRPPLPNRPNNDFVDSLAAGDSGPDMESLAREIFLKFLKETPLMILKGLVELIDPHVALSKMIRDITGEVFLKISQAMTKAIKDTPGPLADSGITGEDLLGLILCLYNIGNTSLSTIAIPEDAPPGIENNLLFGPKMTLDGVDFKGTVAGMLMLTPTPIGIVYLLLEMLKTLLDTLPPGDEAEVIEDASASTENEC